MPRQRTRSRSATRRSQGPVRPSPTTECTQLSTHSPWWKDDETIFFLRLLLEAKNEKLMES